MTLILPSKVTRRNFLGACGAVAGAAACGSGASGQEPTPGFKPCIDFPIRMSLADPEFPTPIEQALELAGAPADGAPRMPSIHGKASAPATLQFAPRLGGPARAPAKMAALNRWQVPVLNVAFDSSGGESLIAKVLTLANTWAEHTGIEFRRSRDSRAEIRVGFQPLPNRPDSGHWSYVGIESMPTNVPRGGKSMNLAINEHTLDTNRYDQAVVLHEFGHALGCVHEHQSAGSGGIQFDRQKTLDYFRSMYGWGAQQTIDNVLNRYNARDLLRFSAFDPDSIMLYQYDASITVDGRGTKQNYGLSATDMSFIAQLYGRTPIVDTTGPGRQTTDTAVQTGPRPITVGQTVGAALTPAEPVHGFTFDLAATQTCAIYTQGYTQVSIQLFQGDTKAEAKWETPDLINLMTTLSLPAGRYRLEVRHAYPGGTGAYGLTLKGA